jgi:hypothetical protein
MILHRHRAARAHAFTHGTSCPSLRRGAAALCDRSQDRASLPRSVHVQGDTVGKADHRRARRAHSGNPSWRPQFWQCFRCRTIKVLSLAASRHFDGAATTAPTTARSPHAVVRTRRLRDGGRAGPCATDNNTSPRAARPSLHRSIPVPINCPAEFATGRSGQDPAPPTGHCKRYCQ